jgi:hypothetical protein
MYDSISPLQAIPMQLVRWVRTLDSIVMGAHRPGHDRIFPNARHDENAAAGIASRHDGYYVLLQHANSFDGSGTHVSNEFF